MEELRFLGQVVSRLSRHEFEQTPGDGEGQGRLECCSPWGCKVGHDGATEPPPAFSFPLKEGQPNHQKCLNVQQAALRHAESSEKV